MGRRRLDPCSRNARKGEKIFSSIIGTGLKLATGSSGRGRSASNGGCMVIVVFVLLAFIFSCVDYEKKYEYRLHQFDYKNAIQIKGTTQKIPQIEFLTFVGGFDTIAIKVKGKKPINMPIQSENLKKNEHEYVTFYNSTDYYTDFRFSLMSKENIIYGYADSSNRGKIEALQGDKFLLFERNDNIYIYPYDEEKEKRESEKRKKNAKKRQQEEDYFYDE